MGHNKSDRHHDDGNMEKCPVCLNNFSGLEDHHVIPTQYGGPKDGKTVRICSSCHRDIHQQAEALRAKNPKRRSILPPDKFERAKKLVALIIQAGEQYEAEKYPDNPKRLVIEINQSLLTRLHKCKKDAGYTNLEQFVKKLLTDYVDKNL